MTESRRLLGRKSPEGQEYAGVRWAVRSVEGSGARDEAESRKARSTVASGELRIRPSPERVASDSPKSRVARSFHRPSPSPRFGPSPEWPANYFCSFSSDRRAVPHSYGAALLSSASRRRPSLFSPEGPPSVAASTKEASGTVQTDRLSAREVPGRISSRSGDTFCRGIGAVGRNSSARVMFYGSK